MSIIDFTDVSLSFGANEVLTNVTLSIERGEYIGIIGPNGGGKSTLIKLLLGLLTPDRGNIKLFGHSVESFNNWSKIGYVAQRAPQSVGQFPLTVSEVVLLGRVGGRGLLKRLTSYDRHVARRSLELVGMSEYENRQINELSGGQLQRVFIAKALTSNPTLLILDEPTVGVDKDSQNQFYTLLHNLNKNEDLTIILVSHDVDVVVSEVTQIICVNRSVVFHGSPKKFVKEDNLHELYGSNKSLVDHDHVH